MSQDCDYVTPEEQRLVQLYVDGGGRSLYGEGWVGRLAVMNAAFWASAMEIWLRQNPDAPRKDQLAQSINLLDRMNLTIPISRWNP